MLKKLHTKLKRRIKKDKLFWARPFFPLLLFSLVLSCYALENSQNDLAEHVVRLHILANSNEENDQALKLAVRDAVLEEAALWLGETANREEAEALIQSHEQELYTVAAAVIEDWGYDYPVTIALEETWFPTKSYEGFSLPAGNYMALRVLIGEAQGENWWCVVFPPLCLESSGDSSESFSQAGLSEDSLKLIAEDSTTSYSFAFQSLELWEELKHALQ